MAFSIRSYLYSRIDYVFYECDLSTPRFHWQNPLSVAFKQYSSADFSSLHNALHNLAERERPFTIEEVSSRLDAGHMLFIAQIDGEIIGFVWVATHYIDVPYFNAAIYLTKEDTIAYNAYIVRDFRGHGIYNALRSFVYRTLKQKGFKRQYGYILKTNTNSLRAAERFGIRMIGTLTLMTVMALEFRFHNLPTDAIVFHGGTFRLWKKLYELVRDWFHS